MQLYELTKRQYISLGIKRHRKSMPVVGYLRKLKICDVSLEPEWKFAEKKLNEFFEFLKKEKLEIKDKENKKEIVFEYKGARYVFYVENNSVAQVFGGCSFESEWVPGYKLLSGEQYRQEILKCLEENPSVRIYLLF